MKLLGIMALGLGAMTYYMMRSPAKPAAPPAPPPAPPAPPTKEEKRAKVGRALAALSHYRSMYPGAPLPPAARALHQAVVGWSYVEYPEDEIVTAETLHSPMVPHPTNPKDDWK